MSNQKKIFLGLLIIVSIITILLIRDYIGVIALSILIVLMFNPVYKAILNKTKGNKNLSTTLVMLVVFLSLLIPIALFGGLTVYQVTEVAHDLKEANIGASNISDFAQGSIDQVNSILSANSINYEVTADQLNSSLNTALRNGGSILLAVGTSIGGKIPEYLTQTILLIVLLGFLFPNQDKIISAVKKISPLSEEINRTYLTRAASMARSMISGTFVVAAVQAIISGITLWAVGTPYILFFTFVLFIASIIPLLGSGLVLVPMALILMATGNVIGGIIVLAMQFIVISNIDNVLRPKLVSEDARLPEAITLLGIIAGLGMFGILGLIFGPVIMVIAYTTYDIYLKYYAISIKAHLNKD